MANKRMFRKDVIDTDAFLDMPLSTQALYFHLNLRADDDGFIGNPKRISTLIGASEDDLKLLIAKKFVIWFENGVIVIKHWRMHNTLSANRYHETNFVDEKSMLRLKDNNSYTLGEGKIINDSHLIEMSERQVEKERRTKDEQKTNADRDIDIEKDIDINISKDISIVKTDCEEIINLYNSTCISLSKVQKLSKKRIDVLKTRLKSFSKEDFETVFQKAEESDFLSGRNGRWGGCGFDWLITESNMIKVMEGNYDNLDKKKKSSNYSSSDKHKWGQMIFDLSQQEAKPYFGFPKEWFEGEKLIEERVKSVIRPVRVDLGWYDEIEISAEELIADYRARKRYSNGEIERKSDI